MLGDRMAEGFLREVYHAQSRRPSQATVYHIFRCCSLHCCASNSCTQSMGQACTIQFPMDLGSILQGALLAQGRSECSPCTAHPGITGTHSFETAKMLGGC